jgi:hypothetical protein
MKHGKLSLTFAAVLLLMFAWVGNVQASEEAADAQAEESAEPEAEPWGAWSRRGLFFGPSLGGGDSDDTSSNFAWQLDVLYRPWRYFGFQAGYFDLGSRNKGRSGDLDGLYLGGSPIIPLVAGVSLFGEGGYANYDGDDAWAAGGGVLYDIPLNNLPKNLVRVFKDRLTLRAGYRYMDFEESAQMGTVGILYRLGKPRGEQ